MVSSSQLCSDDPTDLPILNSYLNARSEVGDAALSARDSHDSHDGCAEGKSEKHRPKSHDDNPELSNRDSFEDFITAINTRGSDALQEEHARDSSNDAIGVVERNVPRDVTPESLAARDITEDTLPEQSIQARNIFKNALKLIEEGHLRRDVIHDHLLTARDSTKDFLNTILSDRDLFGSGPEIEARDIFSNALNLIERGHLQPDDVTDDDLLAARDGALDLIKSMMGRGESNPEQRDTPNGDEFAQLLDALTSRSVDGSDGLDARGGWEDFMGTLNTRKLGFKREIHARAPSLLVSFLAWFMHKLMSLPIRHRDLTPDELVGRDAVDDFINTYMSHAAREPSPEQEIQDRSGEDSAFIETLLGTRDLSKRLDSDNLMRLALLAGRAMDDLD